MDGSENISLTPAEALALAGRARAAAERPLPAPDWYGPVFGAAFAVYGTVLGQAMAHHVHWLVVLCIPLWVVFCVVMVVRAVRAHGVANLRTPPDGIIAVVAVGTILGGAAAGLAVWALTGAVDWAMTAWGVATGAGFWFGNDVTNKRIRRRNAGAAR